MKRTALALLLIALCSVALADVTVKDAWVRGTTPAQRATGAFMEIVSSEDAVVLSASSPAAGATELHTMKLEDGIMKMRAMPRLELPAGKPVLFAPGANHVMLLDLKKQAKPGDVVPITLKIEGKDKKVQSVEVKAQVRDLTATAAPAEHDHQH